MAITRIFHYSHGKKYVAVPEDYSLDRAFRVRTQEGTLNYYVYDGPNWRGRKTYFVLIRQGDGNFRVYYRPRSEHKFSESLARMYNVRPVKVLEPSELSRLLEPEHISQLREAEKMLPYAEPVADLTQ